jgi:hypothetical protein
MRGQISYYPTYLLKLEMRISERVMHRWVQVEKEVWDAVSL